MKPMKFKNVLKFRCEWPTFTKIKDQEDKKTDRQASHYWLKIFLEREQQENFGTEKNFRKFCGRLNN